MELFVTHHTFHLIWCFIREMGLAHRLINLDLIGLKRYSVLLDQMSETQVKEPFFIKKKKKAQMDMQVQVLMMTWGGGGRVTL